MSDEKKLDGELKEGAAAQGERELGVDAQAAGDPRGGRLRASSAGDDKVLRMGTASIPRLITEFAIPSVVGMLINGSYAIIDSVFLGHVVGEIGLSAMTVANPIMIVFMAIAMLIGNGGNALAALRLGEGKRDDAERALGNVVSLSLVAAVIVLVIGWNPALVSWVLDLASATPEVRPYAQTFIQILCAGFILQCIGLGVNNFIRTCGAPNRALGTMVIGLVGSVAFNALFVLALGWGVMGSALATVLGWACSCLAGLQYFCLRSEATQRTRSVVFVGLTIAIMAVSAWVVVPLGPIPFTLQMFAITFAIVVLSPKEAIAAITGYLLLGAVGVPVFSGMRGGIGVLAGPTGGFLWGYLFGVAAAALFLHAVRTRLGMVGGKNAPRLTRAEKTAMTPLQRAGAFLRSFGVEIIAGIIFTVIAYVCGCAQYMVVGHVDLATAFLTAVAPFMVVDLCKIVAAVICADAVRVAVR